MNTFASPFSRRAFSVSQDAGLDPFLSSPISQTLHTSGDDSNLAFNTSSSFYVPDFVDSSVPRSTRNNTSVPDYPATPHFDNSRVTSVNQIAPLLDRIRRFDISDETFHVLDSIDPTFWSLETYIQTCSRISTDSKQMLPLGYYASLVLLTRVLTSSDGESTSVADQSIPPEPSKSNDSTYYYDKLVFVRHPFKISRMLRDALETIQEWMQENEQSMSSSPGSGLYSSSSSVGSNSPALSAMPAGHHEHEQHPVQPGPPHQHPMRLSQHAWESQFEQQAHHAQILEDLRLTVSRFIFVLDQLDKNSSDVECYQSSNWPNASSADKFVRYFPLFDNLLPVRSTSERASTCLNAFLPQLEGLMGTHTIDPFEMAYLYQTSTGSGAAQPQQSSQPWWMEVVIKKVEAWQARKRTIEGSPRKRSFTAMDDDIVGHFRRPSDAMRGRPKKLRRPSL